MTKGIIVMKNRYNYANESVYEDFIKFLMTFLCFCHKSKSAYENCHK
jgi:hypothetical protein